MTARKETRCSGADTHQTREGFHHSRHSPDVCTHTHTIYTCFVYIDLFCIAAVAPTAVLFLILILLELVMFVFFFYSFFLWLSFHSLSLYPLQLTIFLALVPLTLWLFESQALLLCVKSSFNKYPILYLSQQLSMNKQTAPVEQVKQRADWQLHPKSDDPLSDRVYGAPLPLSLFLCHLISNHFVFIPSFSKRNNNTAFSPSLLKKINEMKKK